MRAWWWVLITAHLVWGNPDQFKDGYGNTRSLDTNSKMEEKFYPGFIFSPDASDTKIRSSEGDEREKKQLRFHSWGGKRYGDEEEEEVVDNSDRENLVVPEEDDEDLMTEVSSYPTSNASHFEIYILGDLFRKALTKRIKPLPAFSSWGGKRDPEMMNDISKRSNFYDPIFQKSSLDSKLELSRKSFPSFSSWAGKRAAAFNSWGGKRGYFIENKDYARTKRDHSKVKIAFNDGTTNWVGLGNENIPVITSLTSNSLNSEDNLNLQDHDHEIKNDCKHSSRTTTEDTKRFLLGKRYFIPGYENPISKRVAAFNSWGGKRMSEENPVINKRPVSFNSWAGKRAAAFNSWCGKRAAASNSWGGKRAAAFNSWGGKRTAAFNSVGGKRSAAFNSWGGKRDVDKELENPKLDYPNWTGDRELYDIHFPTINSHDKIVEQNNKDFFHETDQLNTNQDYIFKHATDKNFWDKCLKKYNYLWLNHKPLRHEDAEELNGHAITNNRIRPSFTSWASKRSPFFAPWYGNKIPTMLLKSGKRRPAFSSWGGKRSEHTVVPQLDSSPENTANEDIALRTPEEVHSEELSSPEKKTYAREKREVECSGEKNASELTIEREKRASGSFLKNRVFTRMMLQGGGWPMAFQPMSHKYDFFAWGGKRSFDVNT